MKTKSKFKKISALLMAVSMMVTSLGATVNAVSASDVILTSSKRARLGNSWPNLAVSDSRGNVYQKINPTEREYRTCNEVRSAMNHFQRLGFYYDNLATTITNDGSFCHNVRTKNVYVSWSSAVADGNIETAYGLISIGNKSKGMDNDFYASGDVIAHEYVHLITQQKLNWGSSVLCSSLESAAVIEAYSDILGELSQPVIDWRIGEDLYNNPKYCLRDFKNPGATLTPAGNGRMENETFFTYYDQFKNASKTNLTNYSGSTVLSHAAYLMAQKGIPVWDLEKIWLDSLDKFSYNAQLAPTFKDVRKAVESAVTSNRTFSNNVKTDYYYKTRQAFDNVHIYL